MLTPAAVQAILKTLPVGYYLGAKVDLELKADGDTSFYDPMHNRIVIGYNSLPELDKLEEGDPETENNLRCMLYHEVSHALLTPEYMRPTDVLNVFEDERIETVFSCFYHRVNFKRFVKKVNHWKPGEMPKNPMDLYYRIVRFDEGPEDLVDEKKAIILRHAKLNRSSGDYYEYVNDVREFYKKVCERFKEMFPEGEKPESKPIEDGPLGGDPGPEGGDGIGSRETEGKGESEGEKKIKGGHGPSDAPEGDPGPEEEGEGEGEIEEGEGEGEEGDPLEGLSETEREKLLKTIKDLLKRCVLAGYKNPAFEGKLNQIIMNAVRKKKLMGSSTTAYSGKLDPKIIAKPGRTEDYKWWTKASVHGDHKTHDRLHINLFIDVSGSFDSSERKINELIHSLIQIEKTTPDFDFDVIKMGDTNRIAERDDRSVRCCEGNYLTLDILDLYKEVQNPLATNYNIVVFDGDAQSFDGECNKAQLRRENANAFRAWNHPNCVIISDPSNQDYFKGKVPNAKEIYTRSYTRELEANIIKALQLLFR